MDLVGRLNDSIARNFAVGLVFKDNTKKVNSLDFSSDGKYLISSSDDDSVNIYDLDNGARYKTLRSQKYGCDHVKLVHSGIQSCITASRNDYDCELEKIITFS